MNTDNEMDTPTTVRLDAGTVRAAQLEAERIGKYRAGQPSVSAGLRELARIVHPELFTETSADSAQ